MNWPEKIKTIQPIIRNKYFIVTMAFILWVSIFDQNNLIERWKLSSRISQLKVERLHYINEVEQNNRKMHELKGD